MSIVICVLVVALVISLLIIYKDRLKHHTKMSFKESLDLTDLPIVTFNIDNKKCNFLLDTGASESVINKSCLENYPYQEVKGTGTLTGLDGIKRQTEYVRMSLTYKNHEYSEIFTVTDMDKVFNHIKTETGVTLNGIIGNSFMQKYRYIIDFKELAAYR